VSVNRRRFLTALGLTAGSLVLPSLARRDRVVRADPGAAPKRLIVMFTAHGCVHPAWRMRPNGEPEDVDFELELVGLDADQLSPVLAPLHRHREQLLVIDGLSQVSAYLDPNATEPHGQGHLSALTGSFNDDRDGEPRAASASIDQIVAQQIGCPDRLASLELGMGLTINPISYAGPRAPLPVELSPTRVWERVFGLSQAGSDELAPLYAGQASVLDRVDEHYAALSSSLSGEDRLKLDQHRELVRELEQRFAGLQALECGAVARPDPEAMADYELRHQTMASLLALALSCDATRVGSILHTTLPGELCGLPGQDLHNDVAHYSRVDPQAIATMTTYVTVHANHMAVLLDALAAIPEGDGTLLDNTLVVWVSELGNGEHAYETWPVVIAGGSNFTNWRLGRYLRIAPSTPALAEGWRTAGVHEADWPNDLAGTPHQKLLVSIARAFGVSDDDGELVEQIGLDAVTTYDGTEIDLTGELEGLS
jgi:hypothetical protein